VILLTVLVIFPVVLIIISSEVSILPSESRHFSRDNRRQPKTLALSGGNLPPIPKLVGDAHPTFWYWLGQV
jgi:hypothetical protein